jgi:hypothetical protein
MTENHGRGVEEYGGFQCLTWGTGALDRSPVETMFKPKISFLELI